MAEKTLDRLLERLRNEPDKEQLVSEIEGKQPVHVERKEE